jgi:tetratricopeptide (TPR) repeat protein
VNYNLARVLEALGRTDEAVRYYTAARSIRPETAHELAHALEQRGESDEAIEVFRQLCLIRARNGRHLSCFGLALRARGRVEESGKILDSAIAALREEIQLHPDHFNAHTNLGSAFLARGKGDEAIAEFRAAIRLGFDDAVGHYNLGNALGDSGDVRGAIAAYREAIHLKPDYAEAHTNLGKALGVSGDVRGAIAAYREAIRLKPDLPEPHSNLGNTLTRSGDVRGAIAACREAIRLKPDYANAHDNLGIALRESGDLPGAIAEFREAIRLEPDFAAAHDNLGYALSGSGDVRGAIAAFREAVRLKPDDAGFHYNRGTALIGSGDVRGAIAEFREVIRLKPDYAEAHCNLGDALREQGRYAESLAELRAGHELGSKRPDWRYPSAAWVAQAERIAALAERLPAVLAGTARPADAAEWLAFAEMAYDTKRYAGAAGFWSEALAADRKLGDDRREPLRYNAACAAALAAAGRAEGEPPPDAAAKAELRRKALDWLRAELAAWSKVLDSDDPKARAAVAATLRHWEQDPDLAGVRDGDALATLPVDEQRAWEAFWKDVDSLLKGEARPGPAGSEPSGSPAVRPGEAATGSNPSTPKLARPSSEPRP